MNREPRLGLDQIENLLLRCHRQREPGAATGCPKEFNDYFSFDSWSRDLTQAFRFARSLPWIDNRRAMVLGMSEGATMAAALAGNEPGITDVALLGATGPTPLYDFVVRTYRTGKSNAEIEENLREVETTRHMDDESVPILSSEVLYAELLAARKRVTMRRLPDAGHSLLPAGAKDYRQLNDEIRKVLDWYGED